MADKGQLFHNPNLASEAHNWQKLGENVGYGPDAADYLQRLHELARPTGRTSSTPTSPRSASASSSRTAWSGSPRSSGSPRGRRRAPHPLRRSTSTSSPPSRSRSRPTRKPPSPALVEAGPSRPRCTTPRPSPRVRLTPRPTSKPSSKASIRNRRLGSLAPLAPREPAGRRPVRRRSPPPARLRLPRPAPAALTAAGGPGATGADSTKGDRGQPSPFQRPRTLGFIALVGLAVGLRVRSQLGSPTRLRAAYRLGLGPVAADRHLAPVSPPRGVEEDPAATLTEAATDRVGTVVRQQGVAPSRVTRFTGKPESQRTRRRAGAVPSATGRYEETPYGMGDLRSLKRLGGQASEVTAA